MLRDNGIRDLAAAAQLPEAESKNASFGVQTWTTLQYWHRADLRSFEIFLKSSATVSRIPVDIGLPVRGHTITTEHPAGFSVDACGADENSTPISSAERQTIRDHRFSLFESFSVNWSGKV
jgi:hypothetical protein